MKKLLVVCFSIFAILTGCSEEEGDQTDVSLSFGEIEVVEENLQVYVKGEVSSSEDTFYYTVEQGQEILIEEQSVVLDNNQQEWHAFELNITLKEEIMENDDVPFITFYAKDNSDIVNPHYVPIDIKDS